MYFIDLIDPLKTIQKTYTVNTVTAANIQVNLYATKANADVQKAAISKCLQTICKMITGVLIFANIL